MAGFDLLKLPAELVVMIVESCGHQERLQLASTCRLMREVDEQYVYASLKSPSLALYTETEDDDGDYKMVSLTPETFRSSIDVLTGIARTEHRRKLVKSLKISAYCHFMLSRRDIYKLSERLTRTIADCFDEHLESLTYVNTFYCDYVETTPFNFASLKRLTLGVLVDTVSLDNWLSQAPNLVELDIYAHPWRMQDLDHTDIYRACVEKLVGAKSHFRLTIRTVEGAFTNNNANIDFDELTMTIAQSPDLRELLQHISLLNVVEYTLKGEELKLDRRYRLIGGRPY